MVRVVEVVRLVEVIRVVEVVYRYEENLGVKGPKNKNKDVGLPMTMPQAAGKNILVWTKDKPFRMKRGYILPCTIMRCFLLVMTDKTENGVVV